jgi:hypothetical protein
MTRQMPLKEKSSQAEKKEKERVRGLREEL